MKGKILIIEDEPTMRVGISHLLTSSGYVVKTCGDGAEGLSVIEKEGFDLIITDLKLPKFDGLAILKHVKKTTPETGVIIMTAYADVRTAVQATKDGAFDYIAKPFSNDEILIIVERFLKFKNLEIELSRLKESVNKQIGFENIVAISPSMKDIFDRISSIAKTDIPVLIQGESGTGKELVANAIHNLSLRRDKPYIKINCAAIPENLFESELFGHEKGAFTGAVITKKGKFEFADKGTIFFDEIGDMPLGLQAKLLRVIEDQTITRLGGNKPINVNVRGIFATSKNLKDCATAGSFREDLFYRINIVPIIIPPLRKRKEDIPCLIEHFLKCFGEKYSKPELKVSPSAYESLMSYDYPGNVRELKHAIERAVLLSKNGLIDIKDLPDEFFIQKTENTPLNLSLQDGVMFAERQIIINALKETRGKKIEAAKRLGISRKVLWKKIKEYNIQNVSQWEQKSNNVPKEKHDD
ncbi:sigma-54-dependent Fis family transcriptional regulator [Dissulfurispira thermophila]|uniref:Sigma-54-dependent Fis family transcriptional regulator n=1 Tax=Dissulfurispira thermophila TaxID=2715679 RepID=A0A7G1GYB2_9BACT|nr:sigma-54 dependent transcriptional regulator [Dissulfurispira thermophila]BCB95168.1 sigma-54-dependent Fis family transcriptional regulator [Dissulfurispira thermophila]